MRSIAQFVPAVPIMRIMMAGISQSFLLVLDGSRDVGLLPWRLNHSFDVSSCPEATLVMSARL
jgi:hypothetical protein